MERLEGVVRDIVFQNEESAFCIIKIEDDQDVHTALGTFPYISVGQTLVLHGESVVHATFGKQFKCESYEEIVPSTMAGIEKYLSSGAVAGIGPITAKKLVEKFGAEIFSIIENEPEKLQRFLTAGLTSGAVK